jgi:hypothetical protein
MQLQKAKQQQQQEKYNERTNLKSAKRYSRNNQAKTSSCKTFRTQGNS